MSRDAKEIAPENRCPFFLGFRDNFVPPRKKNWFFLRLFSCIKNNFSVNEKDNLSGDVPEREIEFRERDSLSGDVLPLIPRLLRTRGVGRTPLRSQRGGSVSQLARIVGRILRPGGGGFTS